MQTLGDLDLLPVVQQADLRETMPIIERESLYGMGCGRIAMALLASTFMTPGAIVWTLDKRLAELARRYGVLHCVAAQ